jgi:hypothetical protein
MIEAYVLVRDLNFARGLHFQDSLEMFHNPTCDRSRKIRGQIAGLEPQRSISNQLAKLEKMTHLENLTHAT